MTTANADLPLTARGHYWQELRIGARARTLRRTITETDLVNFISVTGMLEAIFIDAAYPHAAIPGRLVPAALTYSLIEGMLFQTVIQGTGLALLEVAMIAHAPVRVNDTIWAVLETTDLRPTKTHGRAVVTARVEVFNQDSTLVLSYVVKRLLAGDPQTGDPQKGGPGRN